MDTQSHSFRSYPFLPKQTNKNPEFFNGVEKIYDNVQLLSLELQFDEIFFIFKFANFYSYTTQTKLVFFISNLIVGTGSPAYVIIHLRLKINLHCQSRKLT